MLLTDLMINTTPCQNKLTLVQKEYRHKLSVINNVYTIVGLYQTKSLLGTFVSPQSL